METSVVFENKTKVGNGDAIPLTGIQVYAVVKDTSIETVIRQHYVNREESDIESVYTFPLPVGSTLLSLTVDLNDIRHCGVVVDSAQAEERYENAMDNGDTAMRLQQINDNLYTLNMGNLQQNDMAVIEIRYAQLLYWQDDHLRIMIPTTTAPRYGDPRQLAILPHQVPSTSLAVTHQMGLSVCVEGELAKSKVSCPSHNVAIQSDGVSLWVSLVDGAVAMDRDFVLLIHRSEHSDGTAYFDQDLDGRWIAWIPVNPKVDSFSPQPRQVTIVVDCSGSMAGTSIQQAKIALREIVEQLQFTDSFSIINFGSNWHALFPCLMLATAANKEAAFLWIERTEADMGGTALQEALDAAYRVGEVAAGNPHADLLLITDGQTYDVANVVKNACHSQYRHFTVGVGSAVAEDMVRGLAERSGGACELVSPNENMAHSIVSHFKRMSLPPITQSEVMWPQTPIVSMPAEIKHAFSDDTFHLFASFDQCPEGRVAIKLFLGEKSWSKHFTLVAYKSRESKDEPLLSDLTLARLAVAESIRKGGLLEEKIKELGIKYQLQSTFTNYLMVVERSSKGESEFGPELRKVPGMLPAGWGGTSSYNLNIDFGESPSEYLSRPTRALSARSSLRRMSSIMDIPAMLRRSVDSESKGPFNFGTNLRRYFGNEDGKVKKLPNTIKKLLEWGLDDYVAEILRVLVDTRSVREKEIVIVFLSLFSQSGRGKDKVPKAVAQIISEAAMKCAMSAELSQIISREVLLFPDGHAWLPEESIECEQPLKHVSKNTA